jgi:hypothetical protein
MTPQEKLKHLNDWMGVWIECHATNIQAMNNFFTVYEKTGFTTLTPGSTINPIPFEKYLQIIENQYKSYE